MWSTEVRRGRISDHSSISFASSSQLDTRYSPATGLCIVSNRLMSWREWRCCSCGVSAKRSAIFFRIDERAFIDRAGSHVHHHSYTEKVVSDLLAYGGWVIWKGIERVSKDQESRRSVRANRYSGTPSTRYTNRLVKILHLLCTLESFKEGGEKR